MNCPSLVKEWLKDHDTRLINFVLDTVMEFVVESFIEHLKSSHLSLLLSVKEMVDVARKNCIEPSRWDDISNHNRGRIEGIEYIQFLLDSEINKIKEI